MDERAREDMDNNEHSSEGESDVRMKYEEQPPTLFPENVATPAQTDSAFSIQQRDSVKNSEDGSDAKIKLEALPPILFPENNYHVGTASLPQAFTEEKNQLVIWNGDLEWQDKASKVPDSKDFSAPNRCRITILAKSSRDKARLEAHTWPLKLNLQLVHEKVLRNVRGTNLRKAPSGVCLVRASIAREALRKALILGRVGFVFFHTSSTNSGKKVLILQYSFKKKGLTVQLQSYTDAIVHRIEMAIQHRKEAKRTSMRKKQISLETRRRVSTEIWKGTLQWADPNSALEGSGSLKTIECRVLAKLTDGKPEVKADSWPQKLVVQLVPKRLLRNIGGAYLKDSKSVLFYPTISSTLDGLTKVFSTSLAGCIQLTSAPTLGDCDPRVLILLYSPEKKIHIGFIPNAQTQFIRRLENESQQETSRPQNENMSLELSETMPSLTAETTEDVLRTGISISVDTAPEVEEHKPANVMAIEASKSQDGTTEKKGKSFSTDIRIASKQGKEKTVPVGTLEPQDDKGKPTNRHLCYPMQRARELNLLQIESLSEGIAAARREIVIMEENLELARQQERKYEIQESEYAVINQAKRRCIGMCQAS